MNNTNEINCNRSENLVNELINLWKKSTSEVDNSKLDELQNLEVYIKTNIIDVEDLILVKDEKDNIIAFMGIDNRDLKLIFIDPLHTKKGIGKELISLAINKHKINKISLLSHYISSLSFCTQLGFEIDDTLKNITDTPNFITHLKLSM